MVGFGGVVSFLGVVFTNPCFAGAGLGCVRHGVAWRIEEEIRHICMRAGWAYASILA